MESDEIGYSPVAALHGGCVSIILGRKLKKKLCVYRVMAYGRCPTILRRATGGSRIAWGGAAA
jgi:hypothetical protein